MRETPDELHQLLVHIGSRLPEDWPVWPGGWPDQVELALIDAVLSIRSRYGSPTTGVRRRTALYRQARAPRQPDDLAALAEFDPQQLPALLQTQQRTGGALKASAIVEAARGLLAAGARCAADLDPDSAAQRAAYCRVRGLGPVTWQYLLMLVGRPGVKADVWVRRFVGEALDRPVDATGAGSLLVQAAHRLGADPTALDYAVWRHMGRDHKAERPTATA